MSIVSSFALSLPKVGRSKRSAMVICGLLCIAFLSPWSPVTETGKAAASPVTMLYGSAPDAPDSQLQAIVDDTVSNLDGTWGVAIKKLDTGQYAVFNGDKQQVSASLYKMWALEALYDQVQHGDVTLDDYATVNSDDAYEDSVYGSLNLGVGTSMTLRDFAYQMITVSDNTAAHVLVRTLGSENINAYMQQNGLTNSYLAWDDGGDNLTTPIDVLREMEMIATSKMVSAPSSKQMVDTMLDQTINNLIPVGLPDGVPFAHKTGALDGLLHDAGIVYGPSGPFMIVVMTSNLNNLDDAYNYMPKLAGEVYDYFNSRAYSPAMYFPQTRQTVGHQFLKFWQVYGGSDIFGYPVGPEQMRNGVLTQDFQRARFEWHPDQAKTGQGAVPGVVLVPLGQQRVQQLGLQWSASTDTGEGQYFKDTGQAVQGGFQEYWVNNGGQIVFGEPISPEFSATTQDGKTYTVQYFQNTRMEYHPDLPVGHRIVLGNLGTELAPAR